MKPTLFISRPMPPGVTTAARAGFDVHIRDSNLPLGAPEMAAALGQYDAVIPTLGDRFDAAVFDAAAAGGPIRCRVLANFGVGYDHLDIAAARAHGVVVTNTPGTVTDATADIALTLMLMTARRAGEGERLVRAGQWQGWHPTQMLGLHLSGKTVGIVGMGRIGQAIARRCHHGFGMQVVFFNRSPLVPRDLPGARQLATLAAVMATADVVVIAVPGGPATRHLIDAAALGAMQPHAHLVNIARGDVVDEAALIGALAARRIAGAGLDVYENEPKVPQALRALENVVLLPHLGTATAEVREAMGLMAVENAAAICSGRAALNPVG